MNRKKWIGEYNTENNESEKLIGVKLDWKFNFDDHISDIYVKRLVKNQMRYLKDLKDVYY